MRWLWLWLCALALGSASAQAVDAPWRELTLVDGALPSAQRHIVVKQGEVQRWRIRSNLTGELHVHAYRVSVAVKAGEVAGLSFTARASGRFRIEWHGAGSGNGNGSGHHTPPLTTLDVLPP